MVHSRARLAWRGPGLSFFLSLAAHPSDPWCRWCGLGRLFVAKGQITGAGCGLCFLRRRGLGFCAALLFRFFFFFPADSIVFFFFLVVFSRHILTSRFEATVSPNATDMLCGIVTPSQSDGYVVRHCNPQSVSQSRICCAAL